MKVELPTSPQARVGHRGLLEQPLFDLLAGRTGHFRMESGYHGDRWFELDSLFERPDRLRPFVVELGRRLAAHGIEAVCGPVTGGARLAEMIGHALRLDHFVAERIEIPGATGLFPVKYKIPAAARGKVRGKAIAIVDDAISAGSAVRGTCADLLACSARPRVLGALFVFGGAAAPFAAEKGLALECIVQADFGLWKPADCPLCRAGAALETASDVFRAELRTPSRRAQ